MTQPQPFDPDDLMSIGYFGTDDIRANESSSIQLDRDTMARKLGHSHQGDRDRWEPLGYPREIDQSLYREMYERGDIAKKIVEKHPRDTWREAPEIIDDADSEDRVDATPAGQDSGVKRQDGEETAFEAAVAQLFDGDTLRRSLLHRLYTADKLARLFEHSVIVFGTTGKRLSQPLAGVDDTNTSDDEDDGESPTPFDGLDDLNYIAVFSQEDIGVERVTDMNSARYGLVDHYTVSPDDDNDDFEVHWSRAIHVPGEDTGADDLYSTPILKAVWNRLEDLEKLMGGGAEMYWRGAYPGIVVSRDPKYQYDDDGDALSDQIEEYNHSMRRALFPTGAEVKTLSPNISDPSNQIDNEVMMVAAAIDMPQNMLIGNEMGDRATTEDRRTWHEHIQTRRMTYAEPVLLRAVIDRLVEMGILPEPDGGTYTIEWAPLAEPTELENAEIAEKKMNALAKGSGGQPSTIMTDSEIRKLVGLKPEYGAETPEIDDDQPDEVMGPDESLPGVTEFFEDNQPSQPAVADGGQTPPQDDE